ncbi:MAG: hin 2 [Evtepia sp.]|jgi:DNA invertase Pin-like site-specific DNA recombinase|nr:hin 2 [Evtepia sp.]
MQDVEQGVISKIIVYKLDRFSRSTADFGQLWELLQAHDVEFVSVNESFDTSTPIGRAMLNIIMVFAQLERETTAERVRDNYHQRVKMGAWPGGPAPFGFHIGREPDSSGKPIPTLVPNELEQETVLHIFESYAMQESSLGSVARSLNANSIGAPRRKTWNNVSLSRILHSPLYAMADEEVYLYYKSKGLQFSNSFKDFDGLHAGMIVGKRDRSKGKYSDLHDQQISLANHVGMIPSCLWLACQYKLDRNAQLKQAGKGKHTWLSGLLKCGCCGYSIKVNKDKCKYYLICSGRSNLGQCDASISLDIRELEAIVESELIHLIEECPPVSELNREIAQELTSALGRVEEKIGRLMGALAESTDLSMQYINRELKRLDHDREVLLAKQEEEFTNPKRTLHSIDFSSLDFEGKKLVASKFISHILLKEDAAELIWNV